jgi:riboflavin biosynthesis pyrimidine reductase
MLETVNRPWISINLAISADGRIAQNPGSPSGWTSPVDHRRLLDLRRGIDALLVGRATLEADRMTLTVPDQEIQPLRCIASRSGILDPQHPIFSRPGGPIHLLSEKPDPEIPTPPSVIRHHGNLTHFLENLTAHHSVRTLHCEGGGQLIRSLAELDAIDEIHLTFTGHTLFGGPQPVTATGPIGNFLEKSTHFQLTHFAPNSETAECYLTYRRSEITTSTDPAQ